MNNDIARFNMIEQQIRPWEVLDGQVLSLLSAVKRENFVPMANKALAFVDMEIPLQAHGTQGQVMLAPRVEARFLQDAAIQPTDKVLEIGTGFMMVKREVFPKFAAQYPQLKYKPDHVGQANFDGTRYIHAYFDTVIDKESERYLSEDYMFCQWWRNMGGSIWLCPWMRTAHIGTYHFHGDMPAVANYVGEM